MAKVQGSAVMSSRVGRNRAIVVPLILHKFRCVIDKSDLPVEKITIMLNVH
jgi:hypothetical protein